PELAVIIMALERAFDGALVGGGEDAVARAASLRRLAGEIEGACLVAAAQAGDALLGHADAGRGLADDPGVGERLEEFDLARRRPAVAAVAQRHGRVTGERGVGGRGLG